MRATTSLPVPVSPLNQHRRVRRSDRRNQPLHRLHGRRVADQSVRPFDSLHASLQGDVLVLELSPFDDLEQDRFDLHQLARLFDVIERPEPHRLDGRFLAGIAGHHHGFGVWRNLLEPFEDLDAGHVRHLEVKNGGVERGLLQGPDRRAAVGTDRHLVTEAWQLDPHQLLQRYFVVHEQDAKAIRRRGQFHPPT